MRRSIAWPALVLVALLSAVSATGDAQSRGATERLTLVVDVLDRDPTPTIPCGIMGAQPRDVTARVVAVEEGAFARETILLSWPTCSIAAIPVGARFRIRIRRWAATPDAPETRYRVRWSELITAP